MIWNLEKKLEKAMENCNPTDREKRLEDKIRALHDAMRLVGAVSNDDVVSLEDTDDVDDSGSSVVTPSENEALNRRIVFAQSTVADIEPD